MLEILNKLENSEEFKSWRQAHQDYCLSSCFRIIQDKNKQPWQFHYYNKEKDKIVTFTISKEITIDPESKIFKKPEDVVEELEIKNVKIEPNKALKKALKNDKYKSLEFTKTLLLLQQIQEPIWNLSFFTSTYQILNIKLSAISGKIIHQSFESLLSFKA